MPGGKVSSPDSSALFGTVPVEVVVEDVVEDVAAGLLFARLVALFVVVIVLVGPAVRVARLDVVLASSLLLRVFFH